MNHFISLSFYSLYLEQCSMSTLEVQKFKTKSCAKKEPKVLQRDHQSLKLQYYCKVLFVNPCILWKQGL